MYAEVGKVKWISNYSSIELVGFGKGKMDQKAFGLFWANGLEMDNSLQWEDAFGSTLQLLF